MLSVFKRISVDEAATLIEEQQALVVDIRDVNTFANGHINQAIRVDNDNLRQFLDSNDKSRPLVVCCYHGNSSQSAAQMFFEQGFTQSYSMDGGMCEWVIKHPVVSS
ncbi:thiosulfate sulfurtransferase GlpE [Aliikangiella maris]|uniref:Thiosulfate sulfurtransferase GlpE n=2 Tax=Aliikangiella maris TaxID=3162458 RepID=A0ABV3MTK7_9GAMM